MDEGALPFPCPVFGVLPEHPAFFESISFQLNGLVVVFLALSMIWAVMEVIGIYFKRAERRLHAAAKKPEPIAPVASSPPEEGIAPQVTAVIAAAVAFTLKGRRYRIEGIAPAVVSDWAREGRRQIFASHQVR